MKTKNTVVEVQGPSTTILTIRDGTTNKNFNIMKKIKPLVFILLSALISLSASAQSSKSQISIFIDSNAYIESMAKLFIGSSKAHDLDDTDNISITIVRIGDKKANNYTIKSGRFSQELKPNKKYMIYIAKKGYETKSLEVSTDGAIPGYKYVFMFDIIYGFKLRELEI